jgi:hypothetical protein
LFPEQWRLSSADTYYFPLSTSSWPAYLHLSYTCYCKHIYYLPYKFKSVSIFSYFSCQDAGLQLRLSLVWRPNWRGFLCRSGNLRTVLSPKPDITCLFVNVSMVWESPVFGFALHSHVEYLLEKYEMSRVSPTPS